MNNFNFNHLSDARVRPYNLGEIFFAPTDRQLITKFSTISVRPFGRKIFRPCILDGTKKNPTRIVVATIRADIFLDLP